MADERERSLAAMCLPPDGYVFERGIWLSYNVDFGLVSDVVAPLLAGVTHPDSVRRCRHARGALTGADNGLVVFGASGHIEAGPAMPWVHLIAVGGRPQHAKCGLLQFRYIDGSKTITRGFVSSANLTKTGLQSNQELLASDEVGTQATRQTLVKDLLLALKALIDGAGLYPDDQRRAVRIVAAIKRHAPSSIKPTGAVIHSLTRSQLLTAPLGKRPAVRVVIVSPPFAANTDREGARALAPIIGHHTKVDVYTGVRSLVDDLANARDVVFPQAALEELRALASPENVHLHLVPEIINDGEGELIRRLHAKLIATVAPSGQTRVLLGSANFTSRGLLGQNRELLLRIDTNTAALEALLADLGSVPYSGATISPPPKQPPEEWPTVQVSVNASFTVADGQSPDAPMLGGVLIVQASDPRTSVSYRNEAIPLGKEVTTKLNERNAFVDVQSGDRNFQVQIQVDAPPGFWASITPEQSDPTEDPWLARLLRGVQRLRDERPTVGTSGRQKGSTPSDDDVFRLPLQQRLPLLAHHRRELLIALNPDEVEDVLRELLTDNEELAVGRALLLETGTGDPLIRALAATGPRAND